MYESLSSPPNHKLQKTHPKRFHFNGQTTGFHPFSQLPTLILFYFLSQAAGLTLLALGVYTAKYGTGVGARLVQSLICFCFVSGNKQFYHTL